MPRKKAKKSRPAAPTIHEDNSDDDIVDHETFMAAVATVAEKAGWWPGVGAVLLSKGPSELRVPNEKEAEEEEKETTLRVRSTRSMEREFEENILEADVPNHYFAGLTFETQCLVKIIATMENRDCKDKKKMWDKGLPCDNFRSPMSAELESNLPSAHCSAPCSESSAEPADATETTDTVTYKNTSFLPPPRDTRRPHLFEEVLGYDETTGEPKVDLHITWSPTQIRNKVQRLLQYPAYSPSSSSTSSDSNGGGGGKDSPRMTIARLCRQMDSTPHHFHRFMNKKSLRKGPSFPMFYIHAAEYFAKRDEGFVPAPKIKPKGHKRKAPSSDDDVECIGDDGNDSDKENSGGPADKDKAQARGMNTKRPSNAGIGASKAGKKATASKEPEKPVSGPAAAVKRRRLSKA